MPDEPFVASDPNAWLRPYWAELHRQQAFFANLAPELRAAALADAVAPEHPAKAIEIRAWTPVTTRAMLAALDQAVAERHTAKEVELWRATKAGRQRRCVAVYVPGGVDLRLLEDGEIVRTELFRDGPSAVGASRRWRTGRPDAIAVDRSVLDVVRRPWTLDWFGIADDGGTGGPTV